MLLHLVIFSFKPTVSHESPAVLAAHAATQALPQSIALIKQWHCGFSTVADAQAGDYALCAHFDDEQALFAYFEHPAHLAVLAQWNALAELRFVDIPAT